MAEVTKIEWCHHTWSPWMGCTKVSSACDHCYAETERDKRYHVVKWGGPRVQTSEDTRRKPYGWNRKAAEDGVRRRVFCLSLGDFWDNQVPVEWRTEALDVIRKCRSLDWLILTKRPQNIRKMLPPDWSAEGWPHVWLGVTTKNMVEARRRIPLLLRVPARVHWLSVEPLLEPLDLRPWLGRGIDWIIVGGESGTKAARYMDPEWARDLRDQCRSVRAGFFFKQMTKRAPVPTDLQVREYPALAFAVPQAERALIA
jgi:protein gp37